MHVIVNGWPETFKELAPALKPYFTFREELTVESGMVLKDTRIVIPKKMRKRILNQLHEGHLGENKCQAKAAQTVYWPNISNDIAQFVLNCLTCLKCSNQKHKHTTNPLGQEVPIIPWTKLGSDLFSLNGNNYLLIVDYTSRFPIVKKLKAQTRKAVTDMYHSIMSEYGWPDTVVSDNGPCFVSQEFKDLLKSKSGSTYYLFSLLPTSQWTSREICTSSQELVQKSNGRRKKPLQCTTCIQKHPSCKEQAIPNANLIRKMHSR